LRIETGKWFKFDVEQRLCQQCQSNKIEDELHFLFECNLYQDMRTELFSQLRKIEKDNLRALQNLEQLHNFLTQVSINSINILAEFVKRAFEMRGKRNLQNYS